MVGAGDMVEVFPGAGQFFIARQQFLALKMHLGHQALQMLFKLELALMLPLHASQFSLQHANTLVQARPLLGVIRALCCRLAPSFVGRIGSFLRHANSVRQKNVPTFSTGGSKAVHSFYRILQNMQKDEALRSPLHKKTAKNLFVHPATSC